MIRIIQVIFMVIGVLLVSLPAVNAASEVRQGSGGYQSEAVYAGQYRTDNLYMRRSSLQAFTGYQSPTRLAAVSCREARAALESQGRWEGNLKESGACAGPGDPAEWGTGNYLNFLTGK